MRIKYISFIESSVVSMNQIHDLVGSAISEATNTEFQNFEFCNEHRELLSHLQDAFKSCNVIVLLTEISTFISTKSLLFKAMGLKCGKNRDILNAIESEKCISLLNQNQKDAQSAIPVGASVFLTEDGLFSPFALKTSKQRLVMLPIDNKRITGAILNNIADYLRDGLEDYSKEIIVASRETDDNNAQQSKITEEPDIAEEIVTETPNEEDIPKDIYSDSSLDDDVEEDTYYHANSEYEDVSSSSYDDEFVEAPVIVTESPVENIEENIVEDINEQKEDIVEEAEDDDKEIENTAPVVIENDDSSANVIENSGHNRSIIAQTIENISHSSIRVAFAVQEGNNMLDQYLKSLIELKNASGFKTVSVPDNMEITDEMQCKQSVSAAARTAMQKAKSMVGMAVTDVYADADGNDFIYAALADAKKTNVYKIYALEGEDPDTLIETGINSIFEILNARVIEFNENLAHNGNTAKKTKKKKTMSALVKVIIWLVIVLALCCVSFFLIRSYFSGQGVIYELGEKIVSFFSSL